MIHHTHIEFDDELELGAIEQDCSCWFCEALLAHLQIVLEQGFEAGCKTN